MTRVLLFLLVRVPQLPVRPVGLSLLWRIPVGGCLIVLAMLCFLLDDAWRAVRRLLHRGG